MEVLRLAPLCHRTFLPSGPHQARSMAWLFEDEQSRAQSSMAGAEQGTVVHGRAEQGAIVHGRGGAGRLRPWQGRSRAPSSMAGAE
jgi:hypothetical protein